MEEYEFKAIQLIAEAFEARNIKYIVKSYQEAEQLMAGFSIDCGPNVFVRFISCDNGSDVAARVYGLITNIPEEKRARVIEACNAINCKVRHVKFCLDPDTGVTAEYDFPDEIADENLGEVALEIFIRMVRILDAEYGVFMKALYTDEALTVRKKGGMTPELREKLQRIRALMMAMKNESEDDENDAFDEDAFDDEEDAFDEDDEDDEEDDDD